MPTVRGTAPVERTATPIAEAERGTERAVTTALGVENGIDVFAIETLCTNSERLNITHR